MSPPDAGTQSTPSDAAEGSDGLPLGPGVRIAVLHKCGLLALDKPEGIVSHPNQGGGAEMRRADGGLQNGAGWHASTEKRHAKGKRPPEALLRAPYDLEAECYRLPGGRCLYLLNRLDSPTSGLVLATEDARLADLVRALFREHGGAVAKTYYAVVKGLPLIPNRGRWQDRLAREQKHGGILRAVRSASGIPSVANYEFLEVARHPAAGPLSLLRLCPITGRMHQLRVQCSLRGRPILGDQTYGDFSLNRRMARAAPRLSRLFLHAATLELRFRHNERPVHFLADSPLPEAYQALFPSLGVR
ncbi:MAG: hypothetical protein LBG65_06475 [Puniceicoccales bacterium]|jgi:23S rRNA-/tRNA-specific pseudouridylate synthase|nr:hypothetical protein [Puniceicoccales bacterium]